MPWSFVQPDTMQTVLELVALGVGTLIGAMTKISEQIKNGERLKIWSKQLFSDAGSFLMMMHIAAGISIYFELGPIATSALGGVLGRAGTPALDAILQAVTERVSGHHGSRDRRDGDEDH